MRTSFRARIHDPVGPRWTRLVLPSIALITGVLDYTWAALDDALPGPAFFCAMILLLWARPLLGRHRPRNCEVAIEPGRVTITGAGLLNQSIRTDDVVGASTSLSPDAGTSVAIARSGRADRPLHIEVEGAAQANRIREGLGIGFGGYGTLRWKVRRSRFDFFMALTRIIGTVVGVGMAIDAVREGHHSTASWIVLFGATAVAFLGPLFHGPRGSEDGLLWFNDFGVFYGDSETTHHVAYTEIESIDRFERGFRIKKKNGHTEVVRLTQAKHSLNAVSELEVDHIVAQLEDAVRRTRGEVQQTETPPAGVEMLARSSADAPRAWLDRLDATATNMGGGYRSVNLTKEALVAALEDPDAAPDVRVGAARILYRIAKDETKTRVSEIAETVRDQNLRQKMRIVLDDDPDEAAAELGLIDEREQKLHIG